MTHVQGQVYLIHVHGPGLKNVRTKGGWESTVRHYLGWALNAEDRFRDHLAGRGSRLLAHCVRQGMRLELVRTWEGDRFLERKLKRQRNSPRFCPVCAGCTPEVQAA